jgi:uncharacterized protein YjbI with pentapeptide repeats
MRCVVLPASTIDYRDSNVGVAKLKAKVRNVGKIPPSELRVVTIAHETLNGNSYTALTLDALTVVDSTLRKSVFRDVQSRSVCFGGGRTQSLFEDCTFVNCRFSFGSVGNVRLVRCRFESCEFENMFATDLEVIECSFSQTLIKKGVFHGRVPEPSQLTPPRTANEFRSNDFSEANLIDVDFRGGIDLTCQRLPSGPEYLFVPDTCVARAIANQLGSSISDPAEMKRCQSLTNLLEFYCSSGQKTQLIRLHSRGAFERRFASNLTSDLN